MSRRTLLKLLSMIPVAGPAIAKLLIKPGCAPAIVSSCFPSHFPKWDKKVDGLECAGKWVLDIERSRLPRNILFPRAGQIWEAVRDCEVAFSPCIAFPDPQSPQGQRDLQKLQAAPHVVIGSRVLLRKGERVRILEIHDPKPIFVNCVPLRYDELHDSVVPSETRKFPGYRGYKLQIKTAKTIADLCQEGCRAFLNESFKLVQDTN
jgi:hypothetical protein